MGEVDEMFEDLLKSNSLDSQDSGALTDYIKKAREAETKAKVQIYTLKGKKSFEKLKKMEEEEEEDVENENISHNNDNFDDLRRQIEQYKELERLELENIEKLKKERELQQLFYNIDKQEVQTQQEETTRSAPIEQLKIPKFTPPTDPQKSPKFLQEPAPVPQLIQAPIVIQEQISSPVITPPLVVQSSSPSIPSINSNNIAIPQGNLSLSSELLLSPRSRKGRAPETPSSFLVKVISIQWDNAPKSKKNNKIYTISFSMFGKSWKVVRSDENIAEFSKRMLKSKAEGTPISLLTKKSIKKDQQQELINQLDTYFNSINLTAVFKREKSRTLFLKFIAPTSLRDEGYGSIKGTDYEGWYVSAMGLQR